ncbi:MAG TPA: thiamine diphosphokinase [Anaerolineae bacterium]|nr:thiamine diphosphokinase [Anaerolineae bacterium]
MSNVLLIANGDIDTGDWWQQWVTKADVVIAVDGGSRHCLTWGLRPDIVLGDMDSVPAEAEQMWADTVTWVRHPVAKDETDLELALTYAFDQLAATEIFILGAWGGRWDQTIANLLLLGHPTWRNRNVRLLAPGQAAWCWAARAEPYMLTAEVGTIVSLLPLGGDVFIEQTAGLQWPLHQEWLHLGPARGVSNVIIQQPASLQLSIGLVWVMTIWNDV